MSTIMGGIGGHYDPDRESYCRDIRREQTPKKDTDGFMEYMANVTEGKCIPQVSTNMVFEYVIGYHNFMTGMVHTGDISFSNETEAKCHCEKLNAEASEKVRGLGRYVYIGHIKKEE